MTLPKPYYQDERCTIYCGDCREVMPHLGTFDLLLTDPPYGLGEKITDGWMAVTIAEVSWDVLPEPSTIAMAIESASDFIIWGGNYFSQMIPGSQRALVWDKMNGTNAMADCEIALTSLSGGARCFSRHHFSKGCRGKSHPTQKPLPVIQWCLSFVPDAETILDPFMGSGTTLVAAKLEGRKSVGIEINERYCESAAKRLEQGVLF